MSVLSQLSCKLLSCRVGHLFGNEHKNEFGTGQKKYFLHLTSEHLEG